MHESSETSIALTHSKSINLRWIVLPMVPCPEELCLLNIISTHLRAHLTPKSVNSMSDNLSIPKNEAGILICLSIRVIIINGWARGTLILSMTTTHKLPLLIIATYNHSHRIRELCISRLET